MRPRLAVLGLDGLCPSLLRDLCETLGPGRLPHLAALLPGATAIRAELPELSPVNWTSLATGQGPEVHGVFGFTRLDPVSYALSVVDATAVACPTIFDRLGAAGLVSKVLNLPNTYPARPLRGMLVAGFVAPELRRAVHPPVLAAILQSRGYRLEADTTLGLTRPELLPADLAATLESRRMALDLLWSGQDFDLFVFVLTETDRLFHFLLADCLDPARPLHQACAMLLERIDAAVGDFLARYAALPEPKRLLVVSDHGFTRTVSEVDLNTWLRQRGWLSLLGPPVHELDAAVVSPASRALALDPGRIYVHSAARFARGRLHEAEARAAREDLRAALLSLEYQGRPVMAAVHRGAELYAGPPAPLAHLGPDLVCEAVPGFDLKAKFDRPEVFSLHGRSGCHTPEALYWDSARPQRAVARLRDMGQEILRFFHLD